MADGEQHGRRRATLLAGAITGLAMVSACTTPDDNFLGGVLGQDGAGASTGDGTDAGEEVGPIPTVDGAAPGVGLDGGEITAVVPTAGCGVTPVQAEGMTVRDTIPTMGSKPDGCADSKCGAWSYDREYFVRLPGGYVNTHAYPLVLQAPGCGGTGLNVIPLTYNGVSNAGNTVIRVGVSPPPDDIGHATNPKQHCFDDVEGDDSVDWVFYETLYDRLASQLCFDRNRVFVSGNSSGARFGNELACKYAGDASRPVRGVMVSRGDLPDVRQRPTCTNSPVAGMWVFQASNSITPLANVKAAINRAIEVDGCPPGTTYDTATFDDFPIVGNTSEAGCKRIRGCYDAYPLVLCPVAGDRTTNDNLTNPGFSTFLKLLAAAPVVSP